jgi:hypothetical protein
VHGILAGLVVFDVVLVIWAFALPDLWFALFHESAEPTALTLLFLRRCGANWAAFALCQAIAWKRWKDRPVWLAVVAGVRLSDIFTDVTYVVLATDATWFAWATLPAMSAINLWLGLTLLGAYRRRAASVPGTTTQSS